MVNTHIGSNTDQFTCGTKVKIFQPYYISCLLPALTETPECNKFAIIIIMITQGPLVACNLPIKSLVTTDYSLHSNYHKVATILQ